MGSKIMMDEAVGGDVASIPVSSVINAPVPDTTEDWDAVHIAYFFKYLKTLINIQSSGLEKAFH